MAKFTKDEFISGLKEMTILEVKELVDAMKEEFGVDPSAVATLTSAGPNKIAVIKLVRDITGLGLKEAKDLADNGGAVKENIATDEANELKAKFEEAGATVELK